MAFSSSSLLTKCGVQLGLDEGGLGSNGIENRVKGTSEIGAFMYAKGIKF